MKMILLISSDAEIIAEVSGHVDIDELDDEEQPTDCI